MSEPVRIPELLCPAGSADALDAAIQGGADAVYLGGTSLNARIHAGNFAPDALREAVKRAHIHGVKVYLTLNTLVTDRELDTFLDAATDAAKAGVDALIVADAGGASLLRRALPGMELHASTQMSGHNAAMAKELAALGFSRMVAAREISASDLSLLLRDSPIETELFIHGALCVCHSGQCLFSSLVGGRSGNRGECAQPCRLPYAGSGKNETYPLSLKDLSLASHVPELIRSGVASFKIEGRMKSAEYVYEAARIWRRLLDENRAASPAELRALSDVFSRGGFTDGYYTAKIGSQMLGVRSDADKDSSRRASPFAGLTEKVPLDLSLSVKAEEPVRFSLSDGTHTVTVTGDIPQAARTAPMTTEDFLRSLSRFGGTEFCAGSCRADVQAGLMLPVSRLNDLRRRAVERLTGELCAMPERERLPHTPAAPVGSPSRRKSARFFSPEQITPAAQAFFDRIYLPLDRFEAPADGVVMPPVIFDGKVDAVREQLLRAVRNGAIYALVGNPGHLALARDAGLIPVGDYRLNVTNRESAALWERLGISSLLLSPELTLPQMRDIGGDTAAVVYGRIPLMTLEKCVIREIADCSVCAAGKAILRDRRGTCFPVLREWEHRNVVYNSLPTSMSDRQEQLLRHRVTAWHFLFSTESPDEVDAVLSAFSRGEALPVPVRRIHL